MKYYNKGKKEVEKVVRHTKPSKLMITYIICWDKKGGGKYIFKLAKMKRKSRD